MGFQILIAFQGGFTYFRPCVVLGKGVCSTWEGRLLFIGMYELYFKFYGPHVLKVSIVMTWNLCLGNC